jgi:hypothetical protein
MRCGKATFEYGAMTCRVHPMSCRALVGDVSTGLPIRTRAVLRMLREISSRSASVSAQDKRFLKGDDRASVRNVRSDAASP